MKKYRPPALIAFAILVSLILGIYGLRAWYFPSSQSWLLIAPLAALGIALAMWTCPRILHLYPTKGRKRLACVITLVLVPCITSSAFGLGVPALALRMMGPDTQISATVGRKKERFRRCRKQIFLAEYSRAFKNRLCVSARDYERMEEGQRVLLKVRRSLFGTFVFSIEPS